MSERLQREMDRVSRPSGERPDNSVVMTRRTFLHKSVVYGAGAAACGLFPSISTIDMAFAQGGPAFKFAWLSDTHLYPKELNSRFVEKTVRRARDLWTSRKMSARERMGHMATLDGTLGGDWAAVGPDGLKYLNGKL